MSFFGSFPGITEARPGAGVRPRGNAEARLGVLVQQRPVVRLIRAAPPGFTGPCGPSRLPRMAIAAPTPG
jgi:hypothetical protein